MKRSGFTLIELSIVLVIIGLITGGVLVGQDLIRAAQLRAQLTQIEEFKTAMYVFKVKYNCMAGDCTSATQFWGEHSDCGSGTAQTIPQTATCNGNGDKTICKNSDAFCNGVGSSNREEPSYIWQHLANAGLIQGKYSGGVHVDSGNGTFYGYAPDINFPKAALSGGGVEYNVNQYDPNYAHQFRIGSMHKTSSDFSGPLFTPRQVKSIDDKTDDGMPRSGRVRINTSINSTYGYITNGQYTATGCTSKHNPDGSYMGGVDIYNMHIPDSPHCNILIEHRP